MWGNEWLGSAYNSSCSVGDTQRMVFDALNGLSYLSYILISLILYLILSIELSDARPRRSISVSTKDIYFCGITIDNHTILLVSAISFLIFVVSEIVGALASGSLSLLGDAAAMSVDVFTVSVYFVLIDVYIVYIYVSLSPSPLSFNIYLYLLF